MTITVSQLVIYFISSLVISLLAKNLLGMHYSLGPLETIIAGMVNAWMMMDVMHVSVVPQVATSDIAVLVTIAGLVLLAFLWLVLTRAGFRHQDI